MSYKIDAGGKLNNFAVEPKIYQAEPPTGAQKRNYIIMGVASAALVALLIFVASAVS
jgi:hypothetical protein